MPSLREHGEFIEAAAALALASAAVRLVPFRWIVRTLGVGRRRARAATFEPIRLAVQRASRRLPWRTVCLQQGLAAHWMLRRRGLPSKFHYGVRPGQAALSAHVWVTLGGAVVIGEEDHSPHTPVAVFPRSPAGRDPSWRGSE